ncbi:MAG: ABC transporter permease [Lachnospiraceae bacterium]|nr:ABC transporter permease [Lachnospiraceae bacterium]
MSATATAVNGKVKKKSQSGMFLRRFLKRKSVIFSLILLVIIVMACVLAPLIAPYGFEEMDISNRFSGPTLAHLFGTDNLGRDIFSRMLYGGRYSLAIGVTATLVSLLIGIILGSLAGYFGGTVDLVIMRFMDITTAIPPILFAIVIAAILGTGFFNTVMALAITGAWNYARMLRASILGVRRMEYLEAASEINASSFRIIMRHLLPNSFSPLIVQATMGVGQQILIAAGLSFIGLGIQLPNPEWGAMLSAGRSYIRDYPHMVIFPGIAIALTVLALNLLGDALRDAMDPKLKN